MDDRKKSKFSSDEKKVAHDDLETLLEIRDLWVDMPGEMLKGLDLDIKKRRNSWSRWYGRTRKNSSGKWNNGTI